MNMFVCFFKKNHRCWHVKDDGSAVEILNEHKKLNFLFEAGKKKKEEESF